jgi:LmbE family N-acetylglucosaminyl deacetylase
VPPEIPLESWMRSPEGAPPILLAAAHPDDETIAAGARLGRFPRLTIVHVTDGAPRDGRDARLAGFPSPEAYAHARREELIDVMRLAGVGPERLVSLEIPDQQASLRLASLACWFARALRDLAPAAVLVHPYEGGHTDHDATAFGVHAGAELIRRAGGDPPAIVEFASYHATPEGGIVTGRFLPGEEREVACELDDAERVRKTALLAAFATQQRVLTQFGFRADTERFRLAPRYDFTRAPQPHRLWSEVLGFPLAGERWRDLARAALRELDLAGGPI